MDFEITHEKVAGQLKALKGLCQLESMRAEVMQITFNCQNSIVFSMLSVTSKAPKFRERLTSELGISIEFKERSFSGYASRWRIKVLRQFYL